MTHKLRWRFIYYLDTVISGKRKGIIAVFLRFKLLGISWFCLGLVKLRRWLYYHGIFRVKRLPCKVISVGNIVVGGSGKTPAVIAIAQMLKEYNGLNLAVISRGYKSKIRGCAVVSDGRSVLLNSEEAGDEPFLMSRNLPGVAVIIGKDRFKAGLIAVSKFGSQAIILDDGFQYLRLARAVDVVTIDSTRPFGLEHILPRGYLRESLETLRKADAILLTRVDQCKEPTTVRDRLADIAPSVPVFESIYKPYSLKASGKDQHVSLDAIKDRNVLAVCGIANPPSFAETLQSLNPAKVYLLSFPDHHDYTCSDVESIEKKALDLGADMIVTTEKDEPKLGGVSVCPFFALSIKLELIGAEPEKFIEIIKRKCNI